MVILSAFAEQQKEEEEKLLRQHAENANKLADFTDEEKDIRERIILDTMEGMQTFLNLFFSSVSFPNPV